jgi:hypothetical protein
MRPARLRDILTGRFQLMFPEIWISEFGSFHLLFFPSIFLFYQADPRNRRFGSSDSGNQIFLIRRLVSIFRWLVRTSSFPEIFRNTHRGKDTERYFFVLDKVWCTKAKSFEPNRKIVSVRNRIHFLSTFELIVKKHSVLRIRVRNTCLCIYELTSRLTNVGVIYYIQADFQRTQQKFTTHPNQYLLHRKKSPGQL